jgi:hypothetical protein
VDNQVLVRELHGLANAGEQREPLRGGEMAVLAEFVDGDAVHVFHGQVEIAGLGDSAVEQPGDVGVVEPGEDLPLLAEALAKQVGGERQVNELDGDLLLELPVGAMRQVDGAHSAAAEQAIDLVRADALAPERFTRSSFFFAAGLRGLLFFLAGAQQQIHFGRHRGVALALRLNQRIPGGGLRRKRLVEDGLNPQKAFRRMLHRSRRPPAWSPIPYPRLRKDARE